MSTNRPNTDVSGNEEIGPGIDRCISRFIFYVQKQKMTRRRLIRLPALTAVHVVGMFVAEIDDT